MSMNVFNFSFDHLQYVILLLNNKRLFIVPEINVMVEMNFVFEYISKRILSWVHLKRN
jgi:hypothetical protein